MIQAKNCHLEALSLARKITSSSDEAHALAGLGPCALALGIPDEANDNLRQAWTIFQQMGAADASITVNGYGIKLTTPTRVQLRVFELLGVTAVS